MDKSLRNNLIIVIATIITCTAILAGSLRYQQKAIGIAPPPASNDELDVNKAFDELQDEFGDWGEDT